MYQLGRNDVINDVINNFDNNISTSVINFYGDAWAERYKNGRSLGNASISFYNTENDCELCIGGNDILNEYSDITIYSIKIFDQSISSSMLIQDYHYLLNH